MQFSFLLVFAFLFILVSISIGLGIALGNNVRQKNKTTKKSLSSVVGATLAFLGFILALILSMVSSRFAIRKQLVLDEANAIGTAILRTEILNEPIRSESRNLLGEYVDVRARVAEYLKGDIELSDDNYSGIVKDSEVLHARLWSLAFQDSSRSQEPELFALYLQSLNEIIDLHTERLNQTVQYRLSRGIWFLLYFVTILTMLAVGYDFGVNGSGSVIGVVILSLILSTVLSIISALDSGGRGSFIKVSQQPMVDLQQQLRQMNQDE